MTDIRRIVAEHRRSVYVLAGAFAVNVLLYLLVVYPLAQRVNNAADEAGEATRQVVAARGAFSAAQAMVAGKKAADAELRRFYEDVLPSNLSEARRTLYPHLDQLARETNLTTLRYGWEPEERKDTALRKLTMTLNLSGEYSDVRRFVHELETAPEFLVLESVSVTTRSEDRALSVVARVATYYRGADHGN